MEKQKIPIKIKAHKSESATLDISVEAKPKTQTSEPTFEDVMEVMISFQNYANILKNKNLSYSKGKKFRMPNFPSEVSENIVKLILEKEYSIIVNWKSQTGDLHDLMKLKFEVKCFSSTGPTSFGPTEKWSKLYFLDATNAIELKFKCYEIDLSNEVFGSLIKVNKSETFEAQTKAGRRPRIHFSSIKAQLKAEHVKLIFDGDLNSLLKSE